MFLTSLQIILSLITIYLAYIELKEKFRKRTEVAKKEARQSLIAIIILAIIGVAIQVISFVDNQNDKKDLKENFSNLKNSNKYLKSKVGSLENNVETLRNENIKLIGISKLNFDKTIGEINNSASNLNNEIRRNADIQKATNDYLTGAKNIPIFRIYAEEVTTPNGNKVILHPTFHNWGSSPLYDVGLLIFDTIPPRDFFIGNINYRLPDVNYAIPYPMEKDSLMVQCTVYWRGGGYYCYATAKKIDGTVKVKNMYYMTGKDLFKPFNPLESPYIKIPRPANYIPPKDKNGKILKDLPNFSIYN